MRWHAAELKRLFVRGGRDLIPSPVELSLGIIPLTHVAALANCADDCLADLDEDSTIVTVGSDRPFVLYQGQGFPRLGAPLPSLDTRAL